MTTVLIAIIVVLAILLAVAIGYAIVSQKSAEARGFEKGVAQHSRETEQTIAAAERSAQAKAVWQASEGLPEKKVISPLIKS